MVYIEVKFCVIVLHSSACLTCWKSYVIIINSFIILIKLLHLFSNPQILASLDGLSRQLPKLHRSASEPIMNRSLVHADDYEYLSTPKTPINSQFGAFPFFATDGAF